MVNSSDSHIVNSLITLTKGLTIVALSILLSVITNVNPVDADACELYVCVHVSVCVYIYLFSILKGYWHYHAVFFSEPEKLCYYTNFATSISLAVFLSELATW